LQETLVEHISKDHFLQAFLVLMVETFESGRAGYLNRGTSIFETLATITAEEASRPVSANCATIAAHVAHMTLAVNFSVHLFRGERLQVDWGEIWRTVHQVTDEEWRASQARLREVYVAFLELAKNVSWQNVTEIEGALEVLAHNAYHLGEIRHALCTIKPDR
jgi:hypothetical protein